MRGVACFGLLVWMTACNTGGVTDEPDAGSSGSAAGMCAVDAQCPAGLRCIANNCVSVGGCTSDAQCSGGRCVAGVCEAATTCTQDAQCGADQRCVNGGCVPACTVHSDCPSDQHCEGGVCRPGEGCTADVDCTATQICDDALGTCRDGCRAERGCEGGRVCVGTRCADCSSAAQCVAGEVCVGGRCGPGCQSNAECTGGQVCRAQECQPCQDASQCGPGQVCNNGACASLPPCTTDAQCSNTEACTGGLCTSLPNCVTTADCADATLSCVFGTCTRNDTCSSDAQCSPMQRCASGRCTNNGGCNLSQDCPTTQHCEANTCTRNGACSSDGQCAASERCVANVCTRNNACNTDTQCAANQNCADGVCTANGPCARDTDCPVEQSCVAATCTRNNSCTSESQCPASASCVDGVCRRNPSCTADDQCASTQSCVVGVCTENNGCMANAQCAAGQFCSSGVCTQGPQCSLDTQCLAQERCLAGRCEPNPACTSNTECPREQSCQSNVCTRNPTCSASMACPAAQACLNGQCVQTRQCTTNAACQDTTLCNGAEWCDIPGGGVCKGGTPVVVTDGIACTDDTCDPLTGLVTHTARDTLCADGNVCTRDVCEPATGCVRTADDTAVPTQTATGDCRRQVCRGGNTVSENDDADTPPSDGIGCTSEACNNGTPSVTLSASACQDGNACNGAERCVAGTGCSAATAPLSCASNDPCFAGFCDPVSGCGRTAVDADGDGHLPTACGGDDCNDADAASFGGNPEVNGDNRDNNCNGFTDEGFGSLMCPAAPTGVRILDPVTLTATLSGVVNGAHSIRWSVVTQPQANGLALNGATTPTVRFSPVVRGSYTLRARLTQVGAVDQSCDVALAVAGPDEDFNAQLIMTDGVDVDLHLLHPEGRASTNLGDYFYDFNWGPQNAFSCQDFFGDWETCPSEETQRVLPDCHFGNCTACTVVVPDQPACTSQSLGWNLNTPYPFTGGGTVSADANPRLDIDNRRGCYADALGTRVCTPENISIKRPAARTGRYTVAVHYWGEPVVKSGNEFTGNQRGVAPAGKARINVEVELFCKNVGFRRFRCQNLAVDGWCFVADATWDGTQCSAISAVSSTGSAASRAFPHAIQSGTGVDVGVSFDTTPTWENVVATPIP